MTAEREVPEPIYVIWWTTQTECEMLGAIVDAEDPDRPQLTPPEWPEWLRAQWLSRGGRNGRARLWNAFPDALPGGVDPWPNTPLAHMLAGDTSDRHSAGGIVIPLGDLHLVIGLPGFVTTAGMTRLLVHGVDIDL